MSKVDVRLRLLKHLSLIGVLFTALVILVGAWTRLMDAGLGCPDWPGCYGRLVVPDSGVALAHSPDVPLEAFRAWIEMTHRYVASALGFLVLMLVFLGASLRRRPGYPWRVSLTLLAMILVQGTFGAFTVTLKLWPQVVTLHLLSGLAVLLLFLWLHLRLRQHVQGRMPGGLSGKPRQLTPLWGVAIALLVLQLALGGWATSNYAGIACQGFPTCNTQWWPDMDWSEGFHLTQTVGPNYLHGQLHAEARTAIHFAHRLGALALGGAIMVLAWRHWRERYLRPTLSLLLGAYTGQVALGIANVLLWLPLGLALLHTAGAVLLVVAMALSVWRWRQQGALLTLNGEGSEKEWAHA
ncbi:heme A synthase [Litchfieldella qijiaojingensis]|uniref:Heme A synthase n=1 Tax=Litchfieldella qijiaojingensis TaxID=980347 RepID=A0ABQ2YD54_9GAMM|nr:COX15/CtaA family protein [Halomonas qijiaojingensis]GGX79656.1 heme A synthase [Halomonas qijiaojingensis]